MSLLKEISNGIGIIGKAKEILSYVGPFLSRFFGAKGDKIENTIDDTLDKLSAIAIQAENFGNNLPVGATGAEKLAAAAPMAASVILNSSMLIGREVADKAKFQAAVKTILGGVADLLNSLKKN